MRGLSCLRQREDSFRRCVVEKMEDVEQSDRPIKLEKAKVLRMIEHLPERFTLDRLFYHLEVLEKIELAIRSSEEGRTISLEEAKKMFEKCRKET